MDTFYPKYQILPKAQQSLWECFQPTVEQGFVLYGGTAIALQLGHRQSVDFDFFSDKPLDKELILNQSYLENSRIFQDTKDSLSLSVSSQGTFVNISFFGNINMGRIGEPLLTEDEVMLVASLEDLLATKLKTVMQRVEYKDYVDIISLLKHGESLERGLKNAEALYGRSFSPTWCLKTLSYFEDGDLRELTKEDKAFLYDQILNVNMERLLHLPKPNKEKSLSIDVTDRDITM